MQFTVTQHLKCFVLRGKLYPVYTSKFVTRQADYLSSTTQWSKKKINSPVAIGRARSENPALSTHFVYTLCLHTLSTHFVCALCLYTLSTHFVYTQCSHYHCGCCCCLLCCIVIISLEPIRSSSMQDLFSQPHEANKCTQCTSHHKTALETVRYQILTTNKNMHRSTQTQR